MSRVLFLSPSQFTVDMVGKKITINDAAILERVNTPSVGGQATNIPEQLYRINYQTFMNLGATAAELEPYFSPVLKDYVLKVLTKNRLF